MSPRPQSQWGIRLRPARKASARHAQHLDPAATLKRGPRGGDAHWHCAARRKVLPLPFPFNGPGAGEACHPPELSVSALGCPLSSRPQRPRPPSSSRGHTTRRGGEDAMGGKGWRQLGAGASKAEGWGSLFVWPVAHPLRALPSSFLGKHPLDPFTHPLGGTLPHLISPSPSPFPPSDLVHSFLIVIRCRPPSSFLPRLFAYPSRSP